MNVKSIFFVTICVWQIIWFANGLKLSLSNVSSKSAPVKPFSSSSSLKNTVSSSPGETSQASFLSNISPKISSVLNQDYFGNGVNPLKSLNSITSENFYSNSLKETEGSTRNLEATNNNLLSAIQNSLNVQNKNIVSPPRIPSSQLIKNGLLESSQNIGPLQRNIKKNNLISTTQNVLESNSLSNLLSSSQNIEAISNIQGSTSNFEVSNNNLLSSIQKSLNDQNNNIIPSQSFISSSLITDLSKQNIGSLPANPLNNLISSAQNSGLLSSLGNNGISSLPNGLLESNSQSSFLPNSLNIATIPSNQFTQTLGPIQSNTLNSNLQSSTQNSLINTINNNIKASSNTALLGTGAQNNNLIKSASTVGSQLTKNLNNNYSSQQNIELLNNVQNSDLNPYFSNLGPLQSNILYNIQNSQNIQPTQIDTKSTQLFNPSLSSSLNTINNDLPTICSINQVNSDYSSVKSSTLSNNNLINSLQNSTPIPNSNNALLNYLTAINILSSTNPAKEVTNSFVQENDNTNPSLSEALLNRLALSEVLSEYQLPITNPYKKFALSVPDEAFIKLNELTNSDLVSNYNKNVLLQQLNSNVNNNNLRAQNPLTNSELFNFVQNNVAQSNNLENNAILQNLLASQLSPINTVQNLLPTNIKNQNIILSANNQNMLNIFENNLKSSDASNTESYIYNNLMTKLQSPKPINNKVCCETDVKNQVSLYPINNVITQTSIPYNVQNTEYLNMISNTQASSGQSLADILSKINNLPRIPTSLPASFNSLINNNINKPNTAYLESLTQTTTTPSVSNILPTMVNLPRENNFVPLNNYLINSNIPLLSNISPVLSEIPQLYPEIATSNVLNNLKNYPQSIGSGMPLTNVPRLQKSDISESSEIKSVNTVSSSYPLLPTLNPTLSNLGTLNAATLSAVPFSTANNKVQPSLLQTMYPITRLPSVNTNLGPIDNNFLLNNYGNIQNNAFPNFVSASNTPNIFMNGITENIQVKPNQYEQTDVLQYLDFMNKLKLLKSNKPEALSTISPAYLAYLDLISKNSLQSPLEIQQNLDLSAFNLATQSACLNNLAGSSVNLNSNPFLLSNPIQAYNNLYSALNIDSTNTNTVINSESTKVSADGQTVVSGSTDLTESSLETVTETTVTNPYAIPSISDLPNVLASNYLSFPQLYNNLYSQISPSNLIVPKIDNLISTAGLTKSLIELGNEIANRYIDNLRTKTTQPVYPPLVYNPVVPTQNTVSSSIEIITPNTNIPPTIPTQSSYTTNIAVPSPVSSTFTESIAEVEQTYPFPFSSFQQTAIQSEITQGPILPTFYPAEISVYSPSVLPTPNINYPVYPPYFPTPLMNFPPIPPLFPPMPPIIETPIVKMGSNGQDARRLVEILLLTGLLNNNDCNDRGTLEALIALMLAT